jgi:hypothetical protein
MRLYPLPCYCGGHSQSSSTSFRTMGGGRSRGDSNSVSTQTRPVFAKPGVLAPPEIFLLKLKQTHNVRAAFFPSPATAGEGKGGGKPRAASIVKMISVISGTIEIDSPHPLLSTPTHCYHCPGLKVTRPKVTNR